MSVRPGALRRLWTLNATLALGTGLLCLIALGSAETYDQRLHVPWALLAALFALTEIHVVHVQFRRETQTFSLNEIPIVIGLFFASPPELITAQLAGAAVGLIVFRRQSLLKWTYNLAHFGLAAFAASVVFRALVDAGGLVSAREVGATFAATMTAITVGTCAVLAAVAIAEGIGSSRVLVRSIVFGALGTITNTSIALIGVQLVREHPGAGLLLIAPAVVLFIAYRGYTSSRQQHETLAHLSEATRVVQRSLELQPALRSVLDYARDLLHAEVAAVTFLPQEPGEPALEARIGDREPHEVISAVALDPTEGVWARAVSEGRGVLLPRPIENDRLRATFEAQGLRDAIVVPLWGKAGPIGTVLVGNRSGDVETFTRTDMTLLEGFVNHVGIALENVRLVATLQRSLATLASTDQQKDEFLSILSHELRNPTTAVLNLIEVVRADEGIGDEHRAELAMAAEQAQHLRTLVEDLLMDARLSGGAIRASVRVTDIPRLLERVTATCRPWTQRHALAVTVEEDIPPIATDPELLSQILCNLIANAAKNSPPGATITVAAAHRSDSIRLSVADEGIGIPFGLHDRIFDRFAQLDRAPWQGNKGTGLGLSICRRLGGLIGADVMLVRSSPGDGSEFAVDVPIQAARPAPGRFGSDGHAAAPPRMITLDEAHPLPG